MKRILAGFACIVFFGLSLKAQSIYSFEGLGSLNHQGMPHNFAMGEVGIGTPSVWHINTQNPANLIYNTFSTFQVGLEVDRRNFEGEGISGSDTEGSLRFLGYAFPIKPGKWSSSFGILPYSTVNYNTFSEGPVSGAASNVFQTSDNRGEGGLTNFFWANGFAIKKKLFVGFRASFSFGSIENSSNVILFEQREVEVDGETTLQNFQIANPVSFDKLDSYSDLNFLFGAAYRWKLTDDNFINFGATYSPKSNLNGTSEISLRRLTNTGSELDTVNLGQSKIDFALPTTFGFGMSYEKASMLKVGFDIETQAWSGAGDDAEEYNNSFKISVGAEYVPEFDDVNSYWKRIKYSAGLNYQRLPYIVNNQALTDFGINFGASLPVSGFSSLDLAFKWGQLGETSNGLIKETYYKIVIGATINDRWFIKSKYD